MKFTLTQVIGLVLLGLLMWMLYDSLRTSHDHDCVEGLEYKHYVPCLENPR